MRRRPAPRRSGATLLDLTIALAVLAVLAGVGVPRAAAGVDRWRVRGAAGQVAVAYAVAREGAIFRATQVSLRVDGAAGVVTVWAGADTLLRRPLAAELGVTLRTTRERSVFAPTGLGWGPANATVVVSRGRAADTVVVSRLGRVRRSGVP